MAAPALTAAQQQQLTAMGIDWQAIDWTKVLEAMRLLKMIIDLWLSKPLVGAPDFADCAATCKEHFEIIQAVAKCGAACCG